MEPLDTVTARAYKQQVNALQRYATECIEMVERAKTQHVHFKEKKSHTCITRMHHLTASIQQTYDSFKRVSRPEEAVKSFRNLVQISLETHLASRIATLINTVERDSPDTLFPVLDTSIHSVLAMVDPARSQQEKKELVSALCNMEIIELADNSPRRMGVLLLELIKYALTIIPEPDYETQGLQQAIEKRIEERRKLFGSGTPRYESATNLLITSKVTPEECTRLLQKATACKKPIKFWDQFTPVGRTIRYIRHWTGCEHFANHLQTTFGNQIGGLLVKIDKQFKKVITGKIAPENASGFSHKIDTYIISYKTLKDELKAKRRELFTQPPDSALLPLLRYISELRFALSELAVRIDEIKKHSTEKALQVFYAVHNPSYLEFDPAEFASAPLLYDIAGCVNHIAKNSLR